MKHFLLCFLLMTLFSCAKKKVIQLPEISHSEVTEINDVSHAYLFYDATKPDSVELNRKNLISTTNWLINVDKRLKLGQVIPHIKFLQNKKANSSHKNKNAKNYFTCSDISRKNLGFIEFTHLFWHEESFNKYEKNKTDDSFFDQEIHAKVVSLDSIQLNFFTNNKKNKYFSNTEDLISDVKNKSLKKGNIVIYLDFNKNLSFQDYITFKSKTSNSKPLIISGDEFIFN